MVLELIEIAINIILFFGEVETNYSFLTRAVSVQSWSTGQIVAKLIYGVGGCFLFSSTPLTGQQSSPSPGEGS